MSSGKSYLYHLCNQFPMENMINLTMIKSQEEMRIAGYSGADIRSFITQKNLLY